MRAAVQLVERPLVAVLLAGGWMVAFMPSSSAPAWLAVPICMAGVALRATAPITGAALVLAASGVCTVGGAPYAEIEMLLPTIGVLYWLGRYRANLPLGAIFVAGFSLTTALRLDAPWYAAVTAVGVYGAPWLFGRIVWRRARTATIAAAESTRLAAVDLDWVIEEARRAEGDRVARDALAVLRGSVERMRALAGRASARFDARAVAAIQVEGESAVSSLHEVLTSLKESRRPPPPPPPDGRTRPGAGVGRIVAAIGGVALCVGAAVIAAGVHPPLLTLAVAAPTSAMLASRFPLAAGAVTSAAFVVVATGPPFPPDALLPVCGFWAALTWSLVERSRLLPLLVVSAGALLLGSQFGRQGVGFVLVLEALVPVAAYAWQEKDRIVLEEQTRGARLSASIASARLDAERAERRRVAQDLHDGLSYAITAMTVQAQAALALADRDPAAGRRSLDLVRRVGDDALTEIDELVASWERADSTASEPSDVRQLIDGSRALGQRIRYIADDDSQDRLVHRVVQESLTNAARHAPGADITVEIGVSGSSQFVRVTDAGASDVAATSTGGLQMGLAGLSRRVEERGGSFRAGPSDDGGFEVFARWPEPAMKEAMADGGR